MPNWREFLSERFMADANAPGHPRLVIGRPGFNGYFSQNNGDFRTHIAINRDGHRNPEPAAAASGRVWAIGDSFTFGWGVEAGERFPDVAARRAGLTVYNLASPGADVCGYQTLRALMPAAGMPTAVLIGLTLENDIDNYDCAARRDEQPAIGSFVWSLSDTKQFLMRVSALYNFSAIALKRAAVLDNFLKSWGLVAREHAYRRSIEDATLPRYVERTADELQALHNSFSKTVPFSVVLIPSRFELISNDPHFATLREHMKRELASRRIEVIDPFDRLFAAGFTSVHFPHDGHWSPSGHALVAELVAAWLGAKHQQRPAAALN